MRESCGHFLSKSNTDIDNNTEINIICNLQVGAVRVSEARSPCGGARPPARPLPYVLSSSLMVLINLTADPERHEIQHWSRLFQPITFTLQPHSSVCFQLALKMRRILAGDEQTSFLQACRDHAGRRWILSGRLGGASCSLALPGCRSTLEPNYKSCLLDFQ